MMSELLPSYLEAEGCCARRTRWVVMVMVVASILTLAAALNTREKNWVSERISAAKIAERCICHLEPSACLPPKDQKSWEEVDSSEKQKNNCSPEEITQASRYIDAYEIKSRQEIRERIQGYYQMQWTNMIVVGVPVLGFSFDINDLGLVSGLSFTILLVLLRFWLKRELVSLGLVFKKAVAEGRVGYCYDIMSMRQVLMITPDLSGRPGSIHPLIRLFRHVFWSSLSLVLYGLPLFSYFLIAWNDYVTRRFGYAISSANTEFLLTWHVVMLAVLLLLTASSYVILAEMGKLWRKYARLARKEASEVDE